MCRCVGVFLLFGMLWHKGLMNTNIAGSPVILYSKAFFPRTWAHGARFHIPLQKQLIGHAVVQHAWQSKTLSYKPFSCSVQTSTLFFTTMSSWESKVMSPLKFSFFSLLTCNFKQATGFWPMPYCGNSLVTYRVCRTKDGTLLWIWPREDGELWSISLWYMNTICKNKTRQMIL